MNIHTWSTVLSVVGLILAAVFFVLGLSFERSHSTLSAVTAVLGLLSTVGAVVSFLFVGAVAWYSPGEAHGASTALVTELNQIGRPSTNSQAKSTILAGIYAVEHHSPATYLMSGGGPNRFTILISGDSAGTCVTYDQATSLWAWVSGACR